MRALPCPDCGNERQPVLAWRPMTGAASGYHLGAYCPACGRWLQWVKQTVAVVRRAPPKPQPEVSQ